MPKEAPPTLTVAEVVAKYNVSACTVHRMVNRGELRPYTKLPGATGAYVFLAADVARTFAYRNTAA